MNTDKVSAQLGDAAEVKTKAPVSFPGGTCDNSPTFQHWVQPRRGVSPEGTAEVALGFQPSLRDGVLLWPDPGAEAPGYSRDVPPGQSFSATPHDH